MLCANESVSYVGMVLAWYSVAGKASLADAEASMATNMLAEWWQFFGNWQCFQMDPADIHAPDPWDVDTSDAGSGSDAE